MGSSWADSLGVALIGAEAPARATEWARAAEHAGLGSLWIIEDYFHPGAFTLAGIAAAVTERITLGLGVVNPYTRHPAVLAMETAALTGAAPGRIVLGLGSSNRRWIAEQMGIEFKTPLADLRESVTIIRRLLAGERIDFHGERFHLDAVQLEMAPKDRVPIMLGVKGPRALGMAAEIADGVLGSLLTSPAHVRRIRAAAADRPGFVVAAYVPVLIDENGARARDCLKPMLAHYLGVLHGQSIVVDAGLHAERTQPFRDALLRGERTPHLVTDDMVDRLAVAGTASECRQLLQSFAEAGLDAMIAIVPRAADFGEQLARIGAELVPAWKDWQCR